MRAAILVLLLLAPVASAGHDPVYARLEGTMPAGAAELEVASVSAADAVFAPEAGHHLVRLALSFDGSGLGAQTPVADARLSTRFAVELRDAATGQTLPDARFVYDATGAPTYLLPDERDVRVVVILLQGVAVDYALTVTGEPDPTPL